MYMYLLLFTTCLNVETEVQCTAVPSTLTLWMETKWSNPLLIRNLRWHADVTGICEEKTYKHLDWIFVFLYTDQLSFNNSPPPLLPQGTNGHLTVVHIREGHLNHTWMGLGTSTESASLSIGTNTWFRMPDTYILDLNHHWSRVQFAEF